MRIDDEAVLIFLGELSGSADDDLIDLRLGPISAPITAGLDRKKSRAAKKSPAGAGLSLQEEPSNVTFTIDACDNSAADCTRDVMAITKMRFLQRRRGRPRWLESLRRDSKARGCAATASLKLTFQLDHSVGPITYCTP